MNLSQLPALVEGMDFPTYLSDPTPQPSLTSSLVRELLATAPGKVWQNTKRLNPDAIPKQSSKFDLGSAAHAKFVGEGARIVVIKEDDFRKNAARDQRDKAYAAGETPILDAKMPRVKQMAAMAQQRFSEHAALRDILQSDQTLRECSIFWREAGVTCRCRPDFYGGGATPTVVHYKTTEITIAPFTLSKYAASLGWEFIAAHYGAGIKALTGDEPLQYFAVQETAPPYLTLVAKLDNTFLELGQQRRKRALDIWAHCLKEDKWPGWPQSTVRLEAPPWHENAAIAQRDAEQDAIDAGGDLLLQDDDWK